MFVRINLKVKSARKACMRSRDRRVFGVMALGAVALVTMILSLAHADDSDKDKRPALAKAEGPILGLGSGLVIQISGQAIKIPAYASSLYFEECSESGSRSSGAQDSGCAEDFTKCVPSGEKKDADSKKKDDKKKKDKDKPFDSYCNLVGAELVNEGQSSVVGKKPEKNYCELKLNMNREGASEPGTFVPGRKLQSSGSAKDGPRAVVVKLDKAPEKTAVKLVCTMADEEKPETFDADRMSKILGSRMVLLAPPPKESKLELPRKKKSIDSMAIEEGRARDNKDAKSKNAPGQLQRQQDENEGVSRL